MRDNLIEFWNYTNLIEITKCPYGADRCEGIDVCKYKEKQCDIKTFWNNHLRGY